MYTISQRKFLMSEIKFFSSIKEMPKSFRITSEKCYYQHQNLPNINLLLTKHETNENFGSTMLKMS